VRFLASLLALTLACAAHAAPLQSTYFGGGAPGDAPSAMAVDAAGNVYITGNTTSFDLPGTGGGALDFSGFSPYVAKFSGDLKTLIQATYLPMGFTVNGIALDAAGNVLVAGRAIAAFGGTSPVLPATTGAAQSTFGGGFSDGYVLKLAGDLKSFIQGTYIGGVAEDEVHGIAIASNGDVIVTGFSMSATGMPATSGAAQPSHNASAGQDAFVTRLTGDLRSFVRTTFLGGSAADYGYVVAVAQSGDIYVGGMTESSDLAATGGAAQPAFAALDDAFVARLSGDLTTLHRATYLGGPGRELASAIAFDSAGNVYVAGLGGNSIPGAAGGAQSASASGAAAFVTKLAPDLSSIAQTTYVAGELVAGPAMALAADGRVIVVGATSLSTLPGTAGGMQPANAGNMDAFIARIAGDLKSFERVTFLGGSDSESAYAVALAPGTIYIGGDTASESFPGTVGGAYGTLTGIASNRRDAFVSRLPSDLKAGPATHFTFAAIAPATRGMSFPVTITARDTSGLVSGDYAGTVHFTSDDPLAILPADAALTNGTGTFNVTLKAVGTKKLTVTDTVNASITGSVPIVVQPASATHFSVTAPASAIAGSTISVTVTALDASNDLVETYTGSVRFTSTDAAAALPASANLVNGSRSFDVVLKTPGDQTITVSDTDITIITGSTGTIAVGVGPTTTFLVSAPLNATPGTPFIVTVTARDAFGNLTPAYAGTVHLTSNDPAATLPANAALASGTRDFAITLQTAGSRTVTATDIAVASVTGTSTPIGVSTNPAAPAAINFGGQSMGTTSLPLTTTFSNSTANPITVSGVTVSNPQFAATHDCATLAAAATCTVTATFTPAVTQGALNATLPVSGYLTIASSAGDRNVSLAGIAERSLVTHFYNAILRRAPEANGKTFWTGEAARMLTLGANVNETWFAMAQYFYFSDEYKAYNRTNTEFVTDLYRTFFNRAPDAGGLQFWLNELSGGVPREILLAQFMFSAEFKAFTQAIFGNTSARAEVDLVLDMYRGLFKRLPDTEAFHYWVGRFRTTQCYGPTVYPAMYEAQYFLGYAATSPEYVALHRTTPQFVGDLYNAELRRGAEKTDVQFWVDKVDSGTFTRYDTVLSFMTQPEFKARLDAVVAQGCLQH
jgi:hypothetical protein